MKDSDKDNITNEETANVEDAATDVAVETSEDQSTETSNDVESEESSQEAVIEDDSPVSSISLEEKSPSESKQLKTDIPSFRPGDTVVVSVKVKEGQRTRLQAFEGVVMGVKKGGLNSSFIVRKISSGIGVERTFQTHSPLIDSIKVKRKGDVRQAKLFYLRDRSGKSARIKERLD